MRYLSLFSGIGGFELGIQQAYEISNMGRTTSASDTEDRRHQPLSNDSNGNGWRSDTDIPECVGFSEIDKYAIQIYQKHFPEHKNYGNCTEIKAEELPDFDLLVGGFPCQAFSIAGKRRGFDDTRGTLFFDIARILKEKRPRNFVLENVKGLLSHDGGRTFKTIITTLTELGYCVEWQVLNAKNFGVPQNRERVFIVGHSRGSRRPQVFPITGDNRQDTELGISATQSATRHLDRNGGLISENASTIQVAEIPHVLTNSEDSQQEGDKPNDSNSIRRATYSDDMRIRRLTPTECERLMGFPDGWTENGLSDIMEICVNINPAIENQLLTLGTVSSITSDGSGMVFPICQSECKEPVSIVLEELLPEDIAISTISRGNATATLFSQRGISLNDTLLKENLTSEKMGGKSIYKLWKVRLQGHYKKEKLSTILTWINETMQSITSISARTDENIIGVIILFNSQGLSYSNGESLCLRMGNIVPISDTQRYKTLGNGVVSNVVAEIIKKLQPPHKA